MGHVTGAKSNETRYNQADNMYTWPMPTSFVFEAISLPCGLNHDTLYSN